eukprot:6472816-Amphidinium_carterae.1
MNEEETQDLAMTTAAAAAVSDHSTLPYTSSSGERSRPHGSVRRSKSDTVSRAAPRSLRKVKGPKVRLQRKD